MGYKFISKNGELIETKYDWLSIKNEQEKGFIATNEPISEIRVHNRVHNKSNVKNHTVTEIGDSVYENQKFEQIYFNPTLKKIGNFAFSHCKKLKVLVFPESIEEIGERAFYCCESIEEIYIPISFLKIGLGAFSGTPNDVKIFLYNKNTLVGEIDKIVYGGSRRRFIVYFDHRQGDEFTLNMTTVKSLFKEYVDKPIFNPTNAKKIIIDKGVKNCDFEANDVDEEVVIRGSLNYLYILGTKEKKIIFEEDGSYQGITLDNPTIKNYVPLSTCASVTDYSSSLKKDCLTELPNLTSLTVKYFTDEIGQIPPGINIVIDDYNFLTDRKISNQTSVKIERLTGSGEFYIEDNSLTSLSIVFINSNITRLHITSSRKLQLSLNSGIKEIVIHNDLDIIELIGKYIKSNDAKFELNRLKHCDQITFLGKVKYLKNVSFNRANSTNSSSSIFIFANTNPIFKSISLDKTDSNSNKISINGTNKEKQINKNENDGSISQASSQSGMLINESLRTLTKYLGVDNNVVIPKGIIKIHQDAFRKNKRIASVFIPEGVTILPDNLFDSCSNLKTVELPKSLTHIGKLTFNDCESLQQIVIPENVVYIGEDAFSGCTDLRTVILPPYLTQINRIFSMFSDNHYRVLLPKIKSSTDSDLSVPKKANESTIKTGVVKDAFSYLKYLEEVELPEGLTYIGERAFYGTYSLYRVQLPSTIERIEEQAFYDCKRLEEINFPEGLTTVNRASFYGCSSLKKIQLPSTLTRIEGSAFSDCKNLEEIIIPEGVTFIDDHAFRDCKNLKRVHLPSKISRIEYATFMGCSNLEEIIIPEGVTFIGEYAFDGCKNLKRVHLPSKISRIEEYAFSGCENLEEINFPEGLIFIGKEAFAKCSNLKKVTFPSTISCIEEDAFSNCGAQIVIPDGVRSFEDVVTLDWFDPRLDFSIPYKYKHKLGTLVVPEGVTSIDKWTFQSFSFKKVILPYTITHIGCRAFADCKNLEEINLPEGLLEIGEEAFRGCSAIKELVLPSSLKKIGPLAFSGLEKVEKIVLPSQLEEIGRGAFDKMTSLKEVAVDPNNQYFCHDQNNYLISKKDNVPIFSPKLNTRILIIPDGTEIIGPSAYANNTSIESVTIPNSVKEIGEKAFSRCSSLVHVDLGNGVERIANDAFEGTAIKNLVIPDSLRVPILGEFSESVKNLYSPYHYHVCFSSRINTSIIRRPFKFNKKSPSSLIGKTIEIGSFPKTRVPNSASFNKAISDLENSGVSWKYAINNEKLKYFDFTSGNKKYRAINFSEFIVSKTPYLADYYYDEGEHLPDGYDFMGPIEEIESTPMNRISRVQKNYKYEPNKNYFMVYEPISWCIVDEDDDSYTLISVDAIDAITGVIPSNLSPKKMAQFKAPIMSISEYLDNVFFHDAFSETEQDAILVSHLSNKISKTNASDYRWSYLKDFEDQDSKVYLPSVFDFDIYDIPCFGTPYDFCDSTDYVHALGDASDFYVRTYEPMKAYLPEHQHHYCAITEAKNASLRPMIRVKKSYIESLEVKDIPNYFYPLDEVDDNEEVDLAFREKMLTEKGMIIDKKGTLIQFLDEEKAKKLKKIEVPEGVSAIGFAALQFFEFEEIVLPKSLVRLEACCFNYCSHLKTINIPSSVKSLGIESFAGCRSLKSVKIPDGVTIIPKECFRDCSIEKIDFGGVKFVEKWAFLRYSDLDYDPDLPEGMIIFKDDESGNII